MTGPLSSVKVLELASIGPAPFAGMLLADLGAHITRVDRLPAAAQTELGSFLQNDGVVDRGRRSISMNIKDPRAVDVVLDLVERVDIVIEGFRPGVTERLGVGPEACLTRNPRIVYGRMSGWGQTGPLAQSAGHDINYIALSGALHAVGSKDRPPTPPLNLVGDYGGGGMLLALGVLAALHEANRSGCGQVVDAAMTDGAAILMAPIYGLLAKREWSDERENNLLDGAAPFYSTYACADGRYIAVGPLEPKFYQEFLTTCGITDLSAGKQYDRREWPSLKLRLTTMFKTRTRAEWCSLLEGTDACCSPVLSLREAPQHQHNISRGTFSSTGTATQPSPAPRFDRTPTAMPGPAPSVGAHTVDVLRDLGYEDFRIQSFLADHIFFQHET